MVDLSVLDRFLFNLLPLRQEEPVFKVDESLANNIVTKEIIFVKDLDLKLGATWEFCLEFELLAPDRVRLIFLIVCSIVVSFVTKFDYEVWIGFASVIS